MTLPLLLARGTGADLLDRQAELERREGWMPEGSVMELVLHSSDTYRSVLNVAAAGINTAADLVGSQAEAAVDPDQPVLRIRWRKGQAWIRVVLRVLIPLLTGIAIGLLIAAWRFLGHLSAGWVLAVVAALALGILLPELLYRQSTEQEAG